jgi:hypothetical protein
MLGAEEGGGLRGLTRLLGVRREDGPHGHVVAPLREEAGLEDRLAEGGEEVA